MAINVLFVSTSDYNWRGSNSKLLTNKNLNQVLSDPKINDYHTSIADITSNNIIHVVRAAKQIVLQNITQEFFYKLDPGKESLSGYYRLINELYKSKHKVIGGDWITEFNYTKFAMLEQIRTSNEPTLWTTGCSCTYGVGVDPSKTYGAILSKNLNYKHVNIAKPGSSIFWAVDQLLRSDIQPNDIVILGITNLLRQEYAKSWKLIPVTINEIESIPVGERYFDLDYFDSPTHIIHCIRYILQAINFCKKIGAKLYIANILDITLIPVVFQSYSNFIDLTAECDIIDGYIQFIDTGSDNAHPGPKQHQFYANKLLELINKTS